MSENSKKVAIFVTCLVDLFRPQVAMACVKLLEQSGFQVDIPSNQVCCGQPAFNSGNKKSTTKIAKNVITTFLNYDYVVIPSGSCAAMIIRHYETLFSDEAWQRKAKILAKKTFELTTFLTSIAKVKYDNIPEVTYHDACSGLRELNIKQQPRQLLNGKVKESEDCEQCCGFGGTFCVKYPDISAHIVTEKVNHLADTQCEIVASGDLGCLMNIAGRASKMGKNLRCFHIAEILAGMVDKEAINECSAHD